MTLGFPNNLDPYVGDDLLTNILNQVSVTQRLCVAAGCIHNPFRSRTYGQLRFIGDRLNSAHELNGIRGY